jgi:protein TonB
LGRYYPRRAINRRIEGKTRIKVAVAADGTVQEIALIDSQPPGVFDAAAKRAAQSLRYAARPAGSEVVWVDETFAWQLGR